MTRSSRSLLGDAGPGALFGTALALLAGLALTWSRGREFIEATQGPKSLSCTEVNSTQRKWVSVTGCQFDVTALKALPGAQVNADTLLPIAGAIPLRLLSADPAMLARAQAFRDTPAPSSALTGDFTAEIERDVAGPILHHQATPDALRSTVSVALGMTLMVLALIPLLRRLLLP